MFNQHKSAFDQALALLNHREHSAHEIEKKLEAKDYEEAEISTAIQKLQEINYLNDARFAEVFVRSKINRHLGANRILQELQQKGVSSQVSKIAIEEAEVDWFELARQTKESKFGEHKYKDFKEKGKQFRFLQYRGFSFDQINYALSPNDE